MVFIYRIERNIRDQLLKDTQEKVKYVPVSEYLANWMTSRLFEALNMKVLRICMYSA